MKKLFTLALLVLCIGASAAKPQKLNIKAPRKGLSFGLQAHRGLSARYPENTELAFREAGKVGLYLGMETDVQMSSDGVLVCMHDKTIDRTTNGTGRVKDYTFAELEQLWIDGGTGWDERYREQLRIPTFERYLEICREAKLVPYVELKVLNGEGIRKTIEMLHKMGFRGRYVITSFNRRYLEIASKYTDAPLEYMNKRMTPEIVDGCKSLRNCVIRPSARRLTKELVDYCHANGFVVECYGIPVGNAELVARLKAWGVKGGTCNDWQGLGLKTKKNK